ncbi:MAG: Guanylate kinase [Mycoplasmataceae bacterium]|nr:MAG: Guanylate kinase [Mycoplasmataceae bacterium]
MSRKVANYDHAPRYSEELKNKKSLVIISGGSGTGKSSIVDILNKEEDFEKIITSTTRQPRIGEVNKKDYYFVSKELFKQEIDKGNFLEHTIYDGNYYGIHGNALSLIITKRKKNAVVVLDATGIENLMKYCDKNFIKFFIFWLESPSLEFKVACLRKRGDEEKGIVNRLVIEEKDRKKVENICQNLQKVLVVSDLQETAKKIIGKVRVWN